MLRTYLTPMGALATGRVGQAYRANNLRVAYLCGFGFAKVGHSSPGVRDFDFSSIFLLYPLFSRFSAFPPRRPHSFTSLLHPPTPCLFITFLLPSIEIGIPSCRERVQLSVLAVPL